MKENSKRRLLWLSMIVVIALFFLAAGLSDVTLRAGRPWEFWWQLLFGNLGQMGAGPLPAMPSAQMAVLVRVFAAFMVMLLLIAIIGFIISPDFRKKMLREFLRMLAFLAFATLLMNMGVLQSMGEFTQPLEGVSDSEVPEGPGESFVEGMPEFGATSPPWLIWMASFVLAALFAAVIFWIGWTLLNRSRKYDMQEFAQEAQAAIDALQAGADLRNTVIRCYYEMSEVLKTKQGIQRESAMTPREFEQRLTARGLPSEPVQQLTRLFEAVRYGTDVPGVREEHQAIASLTAIVEACRQAKA